MPLLTLAALTLLKLSLINVSSVNAIEFEIPRQTNGLRHRERKTESVSSIIMKYESFSGLSASQQLLQKPLTPFQIHKSWRMCSWDASQVCGTQRYEIKMAVVMASTTFPLSGLASRITSFLLPKSAATSISLIENARFTLYVMLLPQGWVWSRASINMDSLNCMFLRIDVCLLFFVP